MINVVTILVDVADGKVNLKNLSVTPAEGEQPMSPVQLLKALHLVGLDVLEKTSSQPPQEQQ